MLPSTAELRESSPNQVQEKNSRMLKTILLVDDSITTRVAHRVAITRNTKYHVVCASNGQEALEKTASHHPDLIMMDVAMPGMTGLEVCRELRKNPRTKGLPIVLVTFRHEEQSIKDGYSSGCSDYLLKPVPERELIRVLDRYLG
jgi:CheY-like chemotaxis protein